MPHFLVDLEASVSPEHMPPTGTELKAESLSVVIMDRGSGSISALYSAECPDIRRATDTALTVFATAIAQQLRSANFEVIVVNARKAPEIPQEVI